MSPAAPKHSALSPQHSALDSLRLGLFGGSFNPIHAGHLAIARQTREALGLDQILFLPTGDPPHKPDGSLAPAHHRLEMVRLAIGSDPTFAVSDVEIRRLGKSYTIDTIRLLQREYGPKAQLFFLIGLDAFLDIQSWREPAALLNSCSFVIISRPGTSFRSLSALTVLPNLSQASLEDLDQGRVRQLDLPIGPQRLICLNLPHCDISASDIRKRMADKRLVANLLPPSVESYIIHHHLYY